MDNKLLIIGIVFELALLFLISIKFINLKKIRTRQPPLPKRLVDKLKLK